MLSPSYFGQVDASSGHSNKALRERRRCSRNCHSEPGFSPRPDFLPFQVNVREHTEATFALCRSPSDGRQGSGDHQRHVRGDGEVAFKLVFIVGGKKKPKAGKRVASLVRRRLRV